MCFKFNKICIISCKTGKKIKILGIFQKKNQKKIKAITENRNIYAILVFDINA